VCPQTNYSIDAASLTEHSHAFNNKQQKIKQKQNLSLFGTVTGN